MEETTEQLRRELENITGQHLPAGAIQLFREQLGKYLNHLIVYDQHRLIYILYRVDLSEAYIKGLLQQQEHTNAGLLMADLLIDRQLQKIESRRRFRQDDSNIPEDEKW